MIRQISALINGQLNSFTSCHRLTRMTKLSLTLVLLQVFICLPSAIGHTSKKDDHPPEEVEQSRSVFVTVNDQKVLTTFINGIHEKHISVHVTFKNASYVLDLSLNTYLFSPSYVQKIVTENGSHYIEVNRARDLCYYVGTLVGHNESRAAFSTCDGIKGFFVLDNSTFYVTPVDESRTSLLDGLYQITRVFDDNLSQWVCGTKDLKDVLKGRMRDARIQQKVKREITGGAFDGRWVIELYVAGDSLVYQYYERDSGKTLRGIKEIVNAANLLYQPVGFFVVLVGVEVWSTDQITIQPDSKVTLDNWHAYRRSKVINSHYNDVGFLLSKQKFDGSVLGLANVATMCSSLLSGGLATAWYGNTAVSGAILAHEIGHVLGLVHDSGTCQCESKDVSCIMAAQASTNKPSLYFSSCSKDQLKASITAGFGICLTDLPILEDQYLSICGNGILEVGEECDCGRMPLEQCNSNCCNSTTCKLAELSKCAFGGCCDLGSCQLKKSGFSCRSEASECDVAEYCDGQSAICPEDQFKHNGFNCTVQEIASFCWNGTCRNQRSQCKLLFGESAKESAPSCYNYYNVLGKTTGFCKMIVTATETYLPCAPENVLCGTLQCSTTSTALLTYTNYITIMTKSIGYERCVNTVLEYGLRVESPHMSPTGSPCGYGKMCVSQKCVSVSEILNQNRCPVCVNGVCTNKGTCHCFYGYFGATCINKATGLSGGEIAGLIIGLLILAALVAFISYDFTHKKHTLGIWKSISSSLPPQTKSTPPSRVSNVRPTMPVDDDGQVNPAYTSDNYTFSIIPARAAPPIPINAYNVAALESPRHVDYDNNRSDSFYNQLNPSFLNSEKPSTYLRLQPEPQSKPPNHLGKSPSSSQPSSKPAEPLKKPKVSPPARPSLPKAPPTSLKPSTRPPTIPSISERPQPPLQSAKPQLKPVVYVLPSSNPTAPPVSQKPKLKGVDESGDCRNKDVRNLRAKFENA